MMERDLVVLWGMYRGWSNTFIAKKLTSNRKSVGKRIQFFSDYPVAIFGFPVMRESPRSYVCEFCGSQLSKRSEKAAREHVAGHVVEDNKIKVYGVMDVNL